MNENLDDDYLIPGAATGALRLYPNDDWSSKMLEGVVDVMPRLGRAVLFKSEEMIHQVLPCDKWDNYALTVHFT